MRITAKQNKRLSDKVGGGSQPPTTPAWRPAAPGSVISGRSIKLSIERPSRDLPDRFVFGLNLLLGGMRRHVDAQPAQACERGVHSVVEFRLHKYGAGPSDGRRRPRRLSTRRAAITPRSVARLCRSHQSEAHIPHVRAIGRTSTRTHCSSPVHPAAPCRPQNTRALTHRPRTLWPFARLSG